MNHEPIYVPVASGGGRIDSTCGWRGKVQNDGHMFDPGPNNAAKAFKAHVEEHTPHYNYACLNCNSPHNMRIVATVRVKLVQHGDDVFETELDDDKHDWDSGSSDECMACRVARSNGECRSGGINMSYYKCPNCGSTDDLEITVEVRAKLIQYKDNFETEVFGDHEWDDESLAHCDNCNWHGEVFDLQEPDEEIVNGS